MKKERGKEEKMRKKSECRKALDMQLKVRGATRFLLKLVREVVTTASSCQFHSLRMYRWYYMHIHMLQECERNLKGSEKRGTEGPNVCLPLHERSSLKLSSSYAFLFAVIKREL